MNEVTYTDSQSNESKPKSNGNESESSQRWSLRHSRPQSICASVMSRNRNRQIVSNITFLINKVNESVASRSRFSVLETRGRPQFSFGSSQTQTLV